MAANYATISETNLNANASTANLSPYGAGDPYYNQSTGYIQPYPRKKKHSKWITIGVPVVILVIAGAVVGAIFATRNGKDKSGSSSSSSGNVPPEAAASAKLEIGRFAQQTNSAYMVPIYPTTANAAAFAAPTFLSSDVDKAAAWPADSFQPPSPTVTSVRTDRPRLIAPAYKWDALPGLISKDAYLSYWNDTIFGNATDYYGKPPVAYFMDGDSGILDNAREIKMRLKVFSYVYRMTQDTRWSERAWLEIQNAAGNGTTSFGPDEDKWNAAHFLDVAEFLAGFATAYDWMYDALGPDRRGMMMSTMIKYGLQPGVDAYTNPSNYYGWWRTNTTGNWNCVCNNGLTMASLALLGDDTSGYATQLLGLTVDNAKQNCAFAPSDDGTWTETANYWYFGSTGHSEMASSLLTATGSDYGLLDTNTNFHKSGLYHVYAYGPTSLFDWGDHGPNKFSATANAMLLYASRYAQPVFSLFQRDRPDVADPWSMFWYDPSVSGAWWNGLELDQFFDDELDQWAAMRSSFTDINALYIGIKAGKNVGHQTHNDLDVGDFVLDALGTRWAGELGSGDYRSPAYFSNDTQTSSRWAYYRKMTEGQNTIVINKANQDVNALPTIKHDSSGTKQSSSPAFNVPSDSTAYWTTDMTSAYFDVTSMKRGIRMLNGRKQVLLQDEIATAGSIEWRMHTNATVTPSGSTVTLERDGQTMKMVVLNPPDGLTITREDAVRYASDPAPLVPDQANPGISVVVMSLPAGTYTLEVLFNPQWPGMSDSDFKTPTTVPLDSWSLTSHD
jgi:hypothetical protein